MTRELDSLEQMFRKWAKKEREAALRYVCGSDADVRLRATAKAYDKAADEVARAIRRINNHSCPADTAAEFKMPELPDLSE